MKWLERSGWLALLAILVVAAAAAQEPVPTTNEPQVIEEPAAGLSNEPPAPQVEPPAPQVEPPAPQVAPPAPQAETPAPAGPDAPKPLPPEPDLPLDQLIEDLRSWSFWLTLLVALIFGGLGGVVYELLVLQGNIEKFHVAQEDETSEPFPYALSRNLIDLGVWARVIIGGLAAVAAIWILSPQTGLGLVAGAIVAGSAGTSVFRSLQDRLLATLAEKDAADVRRRAALQDAKVQEALAKIQAAGGAATGARAAGGPPIPGAADLQDAERLLAEAHGIMETL